MTRSSSSAIDRNRVEGFLQQVEEKACAVIRANGARCRGNERLLQRYANQCAAWRDGRVTHIRGLTEAVNELCVAKYFLEDASVGSIEYEPPLGGTDQTIDFLVYTADAKARIFHDVKTVHPEERDAWKRYERAKANGWFTPNTELILEREGMGGQIAHELFASREKFLEYAIELEAKIRHVTRPEGTYFRLVFCGTGLQWDLDNLEDFADFYRNHRHRADDPFANMETHYLAGAGVNLDRSIDGFCYFERPIACAAPTAFRCDVRGPAFFA